MGAFGGLILTNKGRALQAKVEAGTQLNFNRIAVGDGDLNGQSISDLNALISEKKSLTITKLKTQSTNQAVVGAVLSNQDIVAGFYFKELGVFAQDPEIGEILFCYGNAGANAEYIPAGGGADVVEKHIDCVTIVGNNATVTATMDQSLIYIAANEKGASGGVATLDNSGSVPGTQLGNVSSVNYGAATGTANTYAVTLTPAPTAYVDGMLVSVKINIDATAASTLNVNGLGAKAVKKANGNDVTNLKANGVYTFRYNVTTGNFILQGEGGSGTAQPGDVLNGKTFSNDAGDQTGTLALSGTANASDVISGKTFYNTDAKTKVTGTIPNNGSLGTIIPGTANQNIPPGYTSGGIVAGDPDLASANIRAGANIYNVPGKASVVETSDANATSGHILSGKTAYVNGVKVTGTIPSVGASTITPGTAAKTAIAVGNYASGSITVAGDAELIPANIKEGVDVFGVIGTAPSFGSRIPFNQSNNKKPLLTQSQNWDGYSINQMNKTFIVDPIRNSIVIFFYNSGWNVYEYPLQYVPGKQDWQKYINPSGMDTGFPRAVFRYNNKYYLFTEGPIMVLDATTTPLTFIKTISVEGLSSRSQYAVNGSVIYFGTNTHYLAKFDMSTETLTEIVSLGNWQAVAPTPAGEFYVINSGGSYNLEKHNAAGALVWSTDIIAGETEQWSGRILGYDPDNDMTYLVGSSASGVTVICTNSSGAVVSRNTIAMADSAGYVYSVDITSDFIITWGSYMLIADKSFNNLYYESLQTVSSGSYYNVSGDYAFTCLEHYTGGVTEYVDKIWELVHTV